MFYFRINKIKIIDNKERKNILGIFGKDLAEVKLLSFVTTDNTDLPDTSEFMKETDATKKSALLSSMISTIVASRILSTAENVKDNSVITFGDTGYVLYQSNAIPENFSWQLIVMESDEQTRDTVSIVSKIISHKEFDVFTSNLSLVLKSSPNPIYVAAVAIGKFAAQVLCDSIKQNKDDMIGMVYMSLDRKEHYPHGIRNSENVPDMTNNLFFDYSIFGFKEK